MRMMFSCLFLESWLGRKKERWKILLWEHCPSPIAELLTKMKSITLFSLSVSLPLSPPDFHLSTLYAFLAPPFQPPFLLSFSLSSLTLFFTPSPITVKLQGGWLGTFLTEKFDCDQNHERALLHSFPNLNDFAASQAHPPRKPDILTYTLFSFAHTLALSFVSPFLCYTHTQTCTYKTQFRSNGGDGTGMRGCSWEKRQRKEDRYRWSHSKVYH